ncbi:MAG: hypothetical protein HC927_01110 [Deltaproteobacteria bacterium]|nr:hypothetical protein [Deltaproteobacteria bacterium]
MKHRKLSLAITGLALAAVAFSVTTSDVQAADVKEEQAALEKSEAAAFPTLPVLMMVLQHQYVLDPTGLVNPTCPYYIAASPQETQESALINEDAAHLLN